MLPSRLVPALCLVATACATDDPERRRIAAYDTLDSCTAYQDEETCLANSDRCIWYALGMPCTEGEPCVSGVCQDIDPCRVHTDEDSCTADADNRCAWAAVELCPGEDCGDGGFCYQTTDDQDCTCVCPLAPCNLGEDCPPCECDCPGDDGCATCTCTETVCPDGDPDCVPSPMDCDCPEGSTGDGSGAPTFEGDPCLTYGDETSCAGDPQCAWLQDPCPLCPECAPGVECDPCECDETFSCRFVGESDCTCVCPDCGPGVDCPPCECTCDGGGGCGEGGSGGGSP